MFLSPNTLRRLPRGRWVCPPPRVSAHEHHVDHSIRTPPWYQEAPTPSPCGMRAPPRPWRLPLAHRGDARGTAHGPVVGPAAPRGGGGRANTAASRMASASRGSHAAWKPQTLARCPQGTCLLPFGGGMSKGGVRGPWWHRTRRVPGKVLLHHRFFLSDPHPEHQEITGEAKDEHDPRPHDQGEPT